MDDHVWLAERFEANRTRPPAAAHRMLGSGGEADDAVQKEWLRLRRPDTNVFGLWPRPSSKEAERSLARAYAREKICIAASPWRSGW